MGQTDPMHLHGAHDRIELVILDFDSGAEWRLDVTVIGG